MWFKDLYPNLFKNIYTYRDSKIGKNRNLNYFWLYFSLSNSLAKWYRLKNKERGKMRSTEKYSILYGQIQKILY